MSLDIPAGTYGIDTMHSQLGFSVVHLGISTIRGTFDRFSGWLTVGETARRHVRDDRGRDGVDEQRERAAR